MKLGRLAQRAKQVMDQRGGSEALKKDAEELRDIARGSGTLQDKAKRAAEALKEPGTSDRAREDTPAPPTPAPPREQAPTDTPQGPPAT